MAVVGIGLDLVKIARIQAILERWEERFLARVYTDAERRLIERRPAPAVSFAGRFAAKEAVLKALGTGWASGVSWLDVQILNDAHGRPVATLHGRAGLLMARAGVTQVHVSVSHDEDYAVAQAVLTTD
ncbi:holo-ACP synthase [Candidatus Nitrospira bockiana]